jgi:5,10-methylene-tetrahydrofolate dehydrogenase/methenyl tetrahydrofolate cyclohydrolase
MQSTILVPAPVVVDVFVNESKKIKYVKDIDYDKIKSYEGYQASKLV